MKGGGFSHAIKVLRKMIFLKKNPYSFWELILPFVSVKQ